jgi:hypothetical protein
VFGQVLGGAGVRHDGHAELGRAEDVIPVGMGQHDEARRRSPSRNERVCAADEPASSISVRREPATAHNDGRSGGAGGSQ